jgi:hypothetical protein
MNKNSLRQIIVTEMILADVEGGDRVPPKKRSLFEMMDDSYLAELEDGRLAHSMKTVEDLFEADVKTAGLATGEPELSDEQEEELKNKVGAESLDLALTIAGFIGGSFGMLFAAPTGGISLVVGAVPDIINGIRKVNRGEYFDGVLDFICAIPSVGEGAAIIKGVHEAEKIVKLIALAKNLKRFGKAVSFIRKMINKFVKNDRKAGAQAAFDDIMSGDRDRIKRAISATGSVTEPIPEPVAMLGGLEYLDSLAQEELNSSKSSGVAESKNASGLSLIGMLYGD